MGCGRSGEPHRISYLLEANIDIFCRALGATARRHVAGGMSKARPRRPDGWFVPVWTDRVQTFPHGFFETAGWQALPSATVVSLRRTFRIVPL
jgi:hypothetical protein